MTDNTRFKWAFTITTKSKCRHDETSFSKAIHNLIYELNIPTQDIFYRFEYADNTKWHTHGYSTQRFYFKNHDFFIWWVPIDCFESWESYIRKDERLKYKYQILLDE